MKKMTIEQKKAKMEMELRKLEVLERVIRDLKDRMHWECMEVKRDEETNEPLQDEDGAYIHVPPVEGDYMFDKYTAYLEVLEDIENLI